MSHDSVTNKENLLGLVLTASALAMTLIALRISADSLALPHERKPCLGLSNRNSGVAETGISSEFRCICSTTGRYVLAWQGIIDAQSIIEACDASARSCRDYYGQRLTSAYVSPPDSFSQTTNPDRLCRDCECAGT